MDQELRTFVEGEKVIVGGHLNSHVRWDFMRRDAIERMHGGWGVGEKNEALYQREVAVGGGNVRPRYMEAYVSVHRPHIQVGMR